MPFIIASEGIKYLGLNLIKVMKCLHIKSYETWVKEIKDRWKVSCGLVLKYLVMLKCSKYQNYFNIQYYDD